MKIHDRMVFSAGLLSFILLVSLNISSAYGQQQNGLTVEISFNRKAHAGPITGRAYFIVSDNDNREPRFQWRPFNALTWGKEFVSHTPGKKMIIDGSVLGFPVEHLGEIPPGDYFVQGFINVYTEFKRSDGHTLWMHNDQWEGQQWNRSPGTLYSDVQKITIDPSRPETIRLSCNNVIPPVKIPPDTKWIKRIKFESKILTEFWGQPMYLGATVLLPKGYDEHPDVHYPVNYMQGHFSLRAPNGFTDKEPEPDNRWAKRGYDFYKYWISDECPRMLAVTLQHPCPYYDDSYVVNSPNVGPYGDAIMKELIPRLEEEFRIIRKPYARVLSGGSTGGWISLAMQIFYPDFFGGTWSLCPDPVDFRYFQAVNIYEDQNAFYKHLGFLKVPTPSNRLLDGMVQLTYEQRNLMELVMGTRNRSGDQIDIFEAAFGPIDEDGYAKSLFHPRTGEIDPEVAEYWREHFDLRHILESNWPTLGPKLKGKLHIYTGDMDTFYLDSAVRLLEEFLESTTDPYYDGVIEYGDRQPHCWGPRGKDLYDLFSEHIMQKAKTINEPLNWKY